MLKIVLVGACLVATMVAAGPVKNEGQGRIAGGMDAAPGQFPYQVSLRNSELVHFCGGAILNRRWIITAASCVQGKTMANILVMVGSQSLTSGGMNHNVDRIVVHPNFNEMMMQNDLAVLRLRQVIVLNENAFAIQMADYYTSIAYGALVSGWGREAMDQPEFPDQLQYIPVNIITNTECEARFEEPYNERISDDVICSSSPVGRGTCLGDAGGPLVHGGELQGVVSWSVPCGMGFPDVYARISVHRPWVLVHTLI